MRDSYLLCADTFAYFTLTGSAKIFLKPIITIGVT